MLKIIGIFPLHGLLFSAGGLPIAAKMAEAAVNADERILPHHQLDLSIHDGECNADRVVNTFINYVLAYEAKRVVGILGKLLPISLIHWFITAVAVPSEHKRFGNRWPT